MVLRPTMALAAALLCAAAAHAELVIDEAFGSAQLPAGWQWRVPVDGPTYSLAERPGWLRVRVPQHEGGYNHWVGADDAPLLTAPLPEGDWDAETHMQLTEFTNESNFHVGMTVVFSTERLLTVGPFFSRGLHADMEGPEVWLEPTGQGSYATAGAPATDVSLRITKRGWEYEAYVKRPDDEDWGRVGRYSSLQEPQALGIIGKTFFSGPGVTLDVDYLRVTSQPSAAGPELAATTIRVRAGAEPTRLDPRRYGHFVELMRRCFYGGFWAEMLENRKFTGEVAETGAIEKWEPVGAGEGVTFARDNGTYYVPAQSQRIACTGDGQEHGVQQKGIELRAGVGVVGRVVLRAEGIGGPVSVSIRREGEVVEEELVEPTREWQTFRFEFPAPPADGDLAALDSFAITTTSAGKLWVGCASLMPADNVDGFRADVLVLCRKMRIPSLRYPGGNFVSGYHWEDGIGPRDQRPPRWDRAWNEWEWNDVGTHEYFRLCELLGCEPYVCVNAGEGTPTEAAEWIEYVNGGPDTRQGRRRAANGHREPFGCPLWSIGNEMYGNWQLGHVDATKYAIRTVEFAGAMRAVDPDIELIGNGVLGPNPWNVTHVQIAGREIDYLSVHHYTGDDPKASPLDNYGKIVATPPHLERVLADTYREVQEHSGRDEALPLMFDEWNVWTRHASEQGYEDFYQVRDGIYAVTMLNGLCRLGDKVPGAHLAQTVNVLGAIRTTKTKAVASPIALAFQLHAEHSGPWGVPIEVETPEVTLPGAGRPLPLIDAVAMLSEDRDELHVILVNRHPAEAAEVALKIAGFTPVAGTETQLSGASFDSINTFEEPDTVSLRERKLGPGGWERLTLPAHGAVAVTLRR